MKYIAKSAWGVENVLDKLERGAAGIEIQLLNPDNEKCLEMGYKVEDAFKLFPIVCIHTPLNAKTDCNYNIETPRGQIEFIRTLFLAEKLMDKTSSRMNIVCHMNLGIKVLQELEILYRTMDFIAIQALLHPNVIINVENVVNRMTGVYDNTILVRNINLPNVGTVIDTCHALMSENFTGKITDNGAHTNVDFTYQPLEECFKQNKDVCRWIHLNNAINTGELLGTGDGHSTPFSSDNKEDMETLTRILKLYKTLDLKPAICLEVKEEDYFNCVNFSKTKKACDEVFKIIGE